MPHSTKSLTPDSNFPEEPHILYIFRDFLNLHGNSKYGIMVNSPSPILKNFPASALH
jgi:hypothetical protein